MKFHQIWLLAAFFMSGCTAQYNKELSKTVLEHFERTDKYVVQRYNNWRLNPSADVYVAELEVVHPDLEDRQRLQNAYSRLVKARISQAFNQVNTVTDKTAALAPMAAAVSSQSQFMIKPRILFYQDNLNRQQELRFGEHGYPGKKKGRDYAAIQFRLYNAYSGVLLDTTTVQGFQAIGSDDDKTAADILDHAIGLYLEALTGIRV